MLLTLENDEALDKLLDGGWGDLDVPGVDLEAFQALDFEWLGTEISTDVVSEPGAKLGSKSGEDNGHRKSSRKALGTSSQHRRGDNPSQIASIAPPVCIRGTSSSRARDRASKRLRQRQNRPARTKGYRTGGGTKT